MRQSGPARTTGDPFFLEELSRLGPDQSPSVWSLEQSQAYCRMWAKRQYENFTVVSFLLPRNLRPDFFSVYAYCRWSDNLADELDTPNQSLELLQWWENELHFCYSGRPVHPVMLALQHTIQRHDLDIRPFSDLLSAFRQDQCQTRYADEAELLDYCARSANPVGQILLSMADSNRSETRVLSDQVCTGLQLANFCQDMCRDAAKGRIYAPRSLWLRHRVSEDAFLMAHASVELKELLAEWVTITRGFFHRGWPLVDLVPPWLATDVDLFVRGGLAILDEIEQHGFDVWSRRPTLSKWKKLTLLARSFLPGIRNQPGKTLSNPANRAAAAAVRGQSHE